MAKETIKGERIFSIIMIIAIIIVGIVFGSGIVNELTVNSYKKEYCIQEGYEFYDIEENKCYNLIPHESNIGDRRIYSGEINHFEVRLK